jgi:predicted metalloprotease with PDZ domain
MAAPIRYSIFPAHPEGHYFEVKCAIEDPDPAGQGIALPAWIPGSYLIRDFARHVVEIRARSARRDIGLQKIDKHTWIAEPVDGPLSVILRIYAWDSSVRGAHLDTSHGFFNGACVFPRFLGREGRRCEVEILAPRGSRYRKWQVATAMRRRGAPLHGFGLYQATNYDELIDHPVEMGTFTLTSFRAAGIQHYVAISGLHSANLRRLTVDLEKLCNAHISLFGGPAPMDHYVFLVNAVGEGYGGLEHRASTALLCSRDELPGAQMKEPSAGYRGFLGLVSHEYFHTWNVKRIKPAAFTPYDLNRENYTRLLWVFEGITSYYDDLLLVRTGLISPESYFDILGRNITALLRTPGRGLQSVAESSFDAWIKYYRQDENAPNAQVSYYLKGSLIGLCLDLLVRRRSRGRRSLDDIMRAVWRQHGLTGVGMPEDGFEAIAEQTTGLRLRSFFDRALRSTQELPLKPLLATVGLDMRLRPAESSSDKGGKAPATTPLAASLGARIVDEPAGIRLTHVIDAGSAQAAGLSAGDVLVAVDGLKATMKTLDQRLSRSLPGEQLMVHAFRRDELREFNLTLRVALEDTCWLEASNSDRSAVHRRRRWLAQE